MNWTLKDNSLHWKEKCPDGDCYTYCGETRTESEPQCPHCKGEGHTYTKIEAEKRGVDKSNYHYEFEAHEQQRIANDEYNSQLSLANQLDAALKLIDLYDNGLTKDNCTQTPNMKLVRAMARKLAGKTLSQYDLVDGKIVVAENIMVDNT